MTNYKYYIKLPGKLKKRIAREIIKLKGIKDAAHFLDREFVSVYYFYAGVSSWSKSKEGFHFWHKLATGNTYKYAKLYISNKNNKTMKDKKIAIEDVVKTFNLPIELLGGINKGPSARRSIEHLLSRYKEYYDRDNELKAPLGGIIKDIENALERAPLTHQEFIQRKGYLKSKPSWDIADEKQKYLCWTQYLQWYFYSGDDPWCSANFVEYVEDRSGNSVKPN